MNRAPWFEKKVKESGFSNAGKYWHEEDEQKLIELIPNTDIKEIAKFFERTEGAIKSRINHLIRKYDKEGKSIDEIATIFKKDKDEIEDIITKMDVKQKMKEDKKVKKGKKKEDKLMGNKIESIKTELNEFKSILKMLIDKYKKLNMMMDEL